MMREVARSDKQLWLSTRGSMTLVNVMVSDDGALQASRTTSWSEPAQRLPSFTMTPV